jgi:uroporphyrinogen-III synthase
MHILITRPLTDAQSWRARLEATGINVTVDPLLTIEWMPPQRLDFTEVQALIVTSRNALRALANGPVLAACLHLPVYAVGSMTGADARNLGFRDVRVGPASARDLAQLIPATMSPTAGRLVHLSGDKLAFDLAAALAPMGFRIDRVLVYRSMPVTALGAATVEAIRAKHIDTVVLLSPLTARTLTTCASNAGIMEQCQQLVYICLSLNVADQLKPLGNPAYHVAVQPNFDEMLVLIEKLAANSI